MTLAHLLALLSGLLSGGALGLTGGGGSILAVPLLVYVVGENIHLAIGTSLVAVGFTSLISSVSYMKYLKEQKLEVELTAVLLHSLFTHPDKSPEELLQLIGFTKSTPETLTQKVTNYATEFAHVGRKKQLVAAEKWVMGQLRHLAIGNMPMAELQKAVAATISKQHQLN